MTPDQRKKIEDAADAALEGDTEGGGFLQRPYSRYRYHNGFTAGAEFGLGLASEEITKLKSCADLLNEPVKEAELAEMIRRLRSWHYHVSERDQFKEMEIERERDALAARVKELESEREETNRVYRSLLEEKVSMQARISKLRAALEEIAKIDTCVAPTPQWLREWRHDTKMSAKQALEADKGE